MADFRFSAHSLEALGTCDHRLRKVAWVALSLTPIDFRVLEGARSDERQEELFDEGKTKLNAGESKHNVGPVSGRTLSHALDFVPVNPVDWQDFPRFAVVAGAFLCAGQIVGVRLRWGLDWNRNGRTVDETFKDPGHIEIDE